MSYLEVEQAAKTPGGRRRWAVAGAVALLLAVTSVAATQPATAAAPRTAPYNWTEAPVDQPGLMIEDLDAAHGVTWAVGSVSGERMVALRRTGDTWTDASPAVAGSNLVEVVVAAEQDVWTAGWSGSADTGATRPLLLHWDGTAWTEIPSPAEVGAFDEVVVDGTGTVWVAGWARNGSTETAVVYQYAGGEWTEHSAGLEGAINGNSLTVLAPDDAWLALNPGLAHFDGTAWTRVEDFPGDGSQILTGFAAGSAADIWASGVEYPGNGAIRPVAWHYDGSAWSKVRTPNLSGQAYDVALVDGQPVVVGEAFDRNWASTPLVLTARTGTRFPRLVQVEGPTTNAVVLTSADADSGRLWVAGGAIEVPAGFTASAEV